MVKRLKKIFDVRKRNKQLLFIVLVFFLFSFFIVRIYSTYVGGWIEIKGYHIHHFYFGTISLALGAILGILTNNRTKLKIASALIGVGIGLFADEIGLLLTCTTDFKVCSYYFPKIEDIILSISAAIIFLIAVVDWPKKEDIRLPKIEKIIPQEIEVVRKED